MRVAIDSVGMGMDMTFMLLLVVIPDRLGLAEMSALVIISGHCVDHKSTQSGHHRHEAGEGELSPGIILETRRRQVSEAIGENVNQSGGEYDSGRKSLDDKEYLFIGAQRGNTPTQYGNHDSQPSGDEDGKYGD